LALTSGEHSGWISPGAGSTRAADPVGEPVGEAIVMLIVKSGGGDRHTLLMACGGDEEGLGGKWGGRAACEQGK
jgi:hypothetical protein